METTRDYDYENYAILLLMRSLQKRQFSTLTIFIFDRISEAMFKILSRPNMTNRPSYLTEYQGPRLNYSVHLIGPTDDHVTIPVSDRII